MLRTRHQLAIREPSLFRQQSDGIRPPPGLALHQPIQAHGPAEVGRRVVPFREKHLTLGGRDSREIAQWPARTGGQGGQAGLEVSQAPRSPGSVETPCVPGDLEPQQETGGHDARERIIGLLKDDHLASSEAFTGPGAHRFVHRVVLEDQQALEQRPPPRHLAPRLDPRQRRMLVLASLGLLLLEVAQPSRELGRGIHTDPHRQSIDERADDGFNPRQWSRAPRGHGAEKHVVFSALAMEEKGPGRLGEGVQGELVTPGEGAQLLRARQGEPHGPPSVGRLIGRGGTIAFGAQGDRRGETSQNPSPVVLGRRRVLHRQPSDVVPVRLHRLQPLRAAAPGRRIERHQVSQKERHRPAVEQGMVKAPDEAPALLAQADEAQPQQRRKGQVETQGPVASEERRQAVLLLHPGEPAPVFRLPRQRNPLRHRLERPFEITPMKRGVQQRLPLHKPLPGLPEGVDDQLSR